MEGETKVPQAQVVPPSAQGPFVKTAAPEVMAVPSMEASPMLQRAMPVQARPAPVPLVGTPDIPVVPPAAALAGQELPEIRKLNLQMLLQDLASQQRTLFEERRYSERRLQDERERSRYEQERIRTEYGAKLLEAEKQNEVLIRTLGRVQQENDHLREQVAVLRMTATAIHAAAPRVTAEPEKKDAVQPQTALQKLGMPPASMQVLNRTSEGTTPAMISRPIAWDPQAPPG